MSNCNPLLIKDSINGAVLETCETCGKEKSATYTRFGVGVLGAALCPKCQKIAKNPAFKTEISHILSTGNGDIDKFFKSNQVIIPICNSCGEDLRRSNWAPSDQARNRHVCMDCKNKKMLERRKTLKIGTTPEKHDKKSLSVEV